MQYSKISSASSSSVSLVQRDNRRLDVYNGVSFRGTNMLLSSSPTLVLVADDMHVPSSSMAVVIVASFFDIF